MLSKAQWYLTDISTYFLSKKQRVGKKQVKTSCKGRMKVKRNTKPVFKIGVEG